MTWNPFSILHNADPEAPVPGATNTAAVVKARERVAELVRSSPVFVFMKGSPQAPMCGYSSNTTSILSSYGVSYETCDVLVDANIRAAAKEFSEWPTFPQVYVRGELVGGDDIITEMHASGELGPVLDGRSP